MQAEMGTPEVEKYSRQREQQMRRPRGSESVAKKKEPSSLSLIRLQISTAGAWVNPWLGQSHGYAGCCQKEKKGKKKREKEQYSGERKEGVRGYPCLCEDRAGR